MPCRRSTQNLPAPLISRGHARALAALLALAFLALAGSPASASERVALVIGNADYETLGSLSNPRNDAEDMAAALEALDFKVFTGLDLRADDMAELIDRFANAAALSDVALFYFAGHAFQLGERNYLIPSDMRRSDPEAAVPLDRIMDAMKRSEGLRLVFLDACRDNPLGLAQDGRNEGLASVGESDDFFVAYATKPGAVAFDGDGRNGIFTDAVLNHISTPGQTVNEMMVSVRRDVISVTGGQQVPWDSSSLTETFRFDEGPRVASEETALYQLANRMANAEMMAFYLKRYPQGAHRNEATDFVLKRSLGKTTPGGSELDSDLGDALWDLARRTRSRPLADLYLRQFRSGRHADEARRLVETLPTERDMGPGKRCETLATHPKDATASVAGTSLEELGQHAEEAIASCRRAAELFPEQPRFIALLARAKLAAGEGEEAVQLYRQAAFQGDLRAQVSLGLLYELGIVVPKDEAEALAYYKKAAESGSPDGMINVAVALYDGHIGEHLIEPDPSQAISLFRQASAIGAHEATYNLGVLAQQGVAGSPQDAFDLFLRAAREGEPRAYRAAAILLDEGFGVQSDYARAASLLLRAAAEDRGDVLEDFTRSKENGRHFVWSPRTIRAAQSQLAETGNYRGAIDGVVRDGFIAALVTWRKEGFDASLLDSN